ncbi:hypothetical protein H5410_047517 [Solanum commersonii]|uniref:Uncharacterized protein n=1 Tax=Solanum commersonii TaxID=4109 RepID=A0A9J5XFD2_SOLCO|nr:hypothetical protein H5410_047517 [Solanum commersonii]
MLNSDEHPKLDLEKAYDHQFEGLRQRDPISPMLFILVMKALSRMMDIVVLGGHVKGFNVAVRGGFVLAVAAPCTTYLGLPLGALNKYINVGIWYFREKRLAFVDRVTWYQLLVGVGRNPVELVEEFPSISKVHVKGDGHGGGSLEYKEDNKGRKYFGIKRDFLDWEVKAHEIFLVKSIWISKVLRKICERHVVLLGSWKMQKEVQGMECCSYGIDMDRLERVREKQEGLLRDRIEVFAVKEYLRSLIYFWCIHIFRGCIEDWVGQLLEDIKRLVISSICPNLGGRSYLVPILVRGSRYPWAVELVGVHKLARHHGWLYCPPFGDNIGLIIPSKVPLSESFNKNIPPGESYTPKEVIDRQDV